ncbi:MAG: NADPH:quinone reductase [Sphingomonadales bacterium]|jgi:NADPH2:quinone reductase|nr:NADPH:quinone reductase [Sphingomonadales bacterium]
MGGIRAVLVGTHGGVERLVPGRHEIRRPGPGEIRIRCAAIGVNFVDIHEREGLAPYDKRSFPFVPGSEGAGIVAEIGAGVEGIATGDRVTWWVPLSESYAEEVILPAARAVPVPDGIDPRIAAAAFVQGLTAHSLVTSSFPVAPGDWAVVHAGAGGVGLLLIQMIRLRGGRVIATASTEGKRKIARAAGADITVDYGDLAPAVAAATGATGASVVYDSVGRATFEASLSALRERGTLVLYGASSGKAPPLDLQRLAQLGSLTVTHPALRSFVATRAELLERSAQLFEWIAAGTVKVRIGGSFPLEEAQRAHEEMAARRTTGKLLLIP